MHRLLQRQIKRYLKTSEPFSEDLQNFLNAVDNAYYENDEDRAMLERAFELSSQELIELNEGLKNALNRFESIIENTPFIAIQGFNRQGVIIHWNHASTIIYGYSEQETKGKRVQDLILSSVTIEDFNNALERVWTSMMPSDSSELEVKNRNNEKRWVFSSMFPIVERGKVTEVFSMSLDITERKRLEKQLIHAQKMEAIGTLAGGIAHDFNNLLMGIMGYTQIMRLDMGPSHHHHEKLERIEMQVKSGADLASQLLGFARGGRYEVKPLNLNEIIKQIAHTFARTKKEILLSLNLSDNLFSIEADKGQMEQVFLNLFVNAWQAMPNGGDLTILTENTILNESYTNSYNLPSGKYAKVSVMDSGTGMDRKTMDRIFEPFFTTREMGRGTGLGLATVYGIIKAHKGIIAVNSEPGQGTAFHIYLPSTSKQPVHEFLESGGIYSGKGTILVVDDESIVLDVTVEILKTLGYNVMTASNGREAVALYNDHWKEIELVILDIIMPGMSGDMTFDELQCINPLVKVILASGYSLAAPAKKILEKGALAFIQKPYDIGELSSKISNILNSLSTNNMN